MSDASDDRPAPPAKRALPPGMLSPEEVEARLAAQGPSSLGGRLRGAAEEWIYDLNARGHWLFGAYEWLNVQCARLVFRGVRRRAMSYTATLEGKGGRAEMRFLTPSDEEGFAALLSRFDFAHQPPHALDAVTAGRVLRRTSYLPFGIFYAGELVGYVLVRYLAPRSAFTGVWSIPAVYNKGFSQAAVKATHPFMRSQWLFDYVTVPLENVWSLQGAQWAGWRIIRSNKRFHVLLRGTEILDNV
ncbi:MAG: hypothetical protein JRG80_08215 [Deltaproteobacteria bacterium]|nr:hypothetical protein [Deltaproteobacteria bacterium]MBW2399243.1 hypothetical protein [Deltaproteobacteria bacterium]MBW2665323.1 hypothetical protein [Deltaproteobacteria bacterium]